MAERRQNLTYYDELGQDLENVSINEDRLAPQPEQEVVAGTSYKVPKTIAGYREDDPDGVFLCASCAAFVPDTSCLLLKTKVDADGHCNMWQLGPGATKEQAEDLLLKSEVNFGVSPNGFNCESCTRFRSPDQCSVVVGAVKPTGLCNLFRRAPTRVPAGLGMATRLLGAVPTVE